MKSLHTAQQRVPPLDHLEKVKDIIADPSLFLFGTETPGIQYTGALSDTGKACQPTSENACRWTLRGAVLKTAPNLDQAHETLVWLEETAAKLDLDANLRNPMSHLTALKILRGAMQ